VPTLDFVRAYFGSPKLGELLASDPRVTHVLCGHTHSQADVMIGGLRAINIGSTYTQKRVLTLDL
jgi:predicted phosphodiesterase